MKREYVMSDEKKIEIEERPLASPLSMDDLQGLFYLAGLCECVALLSFFSEFLISKVQSRPQSQATIVQVR